MVMKRNSDIDLRRRNKRTRDGFDVLHTLNEDRFLTENERRFRDRHSPGARIYRKRERYPNVNFPVKSNFLSSSMRHRRTEEEEKASIRVTNFTRSATDHILFDKLNNEFKKFGDINVQILRNKSERYAVVNFRNSDDAFEAQRSIENRGHAIFLQDRALNFQFCIPRQRSGRFVSDHLEEKRSSRVSAVPRTHNEIHNSEDRHRLRERSGNHDSDTEANDPLATRTLFVGNLESSISRQDVRSQFERFGLVEDVDIKRPVRGQGNNYAFVKFISLDVASKAKVAMQGSLLGRNRVKIGYGKSLPTTRLWIGGLGPWTSIAELEREFDRFGAIRRIDYNVGHDHAFILYDSQDAASVAATEMRGFKINGSRLKIDFAELSQGLEEYPDTLGHLSDKQENSEIKPLSGKESFKKERSNSEGSVKWNDSTSNRGLSNKKQVDQTKVARKKSDERRLYHSHQSLSPSKDLKTRKINEKRDDRPRIKEKRKVGNGESSSHSPPSKRRRTAFGPPLVLSPQRFGSLSPELQHQTASSPNILDKLPSQDENFPEKDDFEKIFTDKNGEKEKASTSAEELAASKSETLQDIAKRFAVAWRGCLILKNSSFPVRLHLIGGNPEIVEDLLRNAPGNNLPNTILRISQRLRLDQPRLEEVSKRMNTAGAIGYCMLLALPGVVVESSFDTETATQQRSLRNLVTYLKQKQAAGVVNLINSSTPSASNNKDDDGVLHAFPPCQYSHDQLLKIAPHLGQKALNDDHLLVVVIRGPA